MSNPKGTIVFSPDGTTACSTYETIVEGSNKTLTIVGPSTAAIPRIVEYANLVAVNLNTTPAIVPTPTTPPSSTSEPTVSNATTWDSVPLKTASQALAGARVIDIGILGFVYPGHMGNNVITVNSLPSVGQDPASFIQQNWKWVLSGGVISLKFKVPVISEYEAKTTYSDIGQVTSMGITMVEGAGYSASGYMSISTQPEDPSTVTTSVNYAEGGNMKGVNMYFNTYKSASTVANPNLIKTLCRVTRGNTYYCNIKVKESVGDATLLFSTSSYNKDPYKVPLNAPPPTPAPTSTPKPTTSPGGTVNCGSMPVNTTIIDKGLLQALSGLYEGNYVRPGGAAGWQISEGQTISMKFTTPNDSNVAFQFSSQETVPVTSGSKEVSVSTCPGVFSGSGVLYKGRSGLIDNIATCVCNTWYTPNGVGIARLLPNKTYYLNMKAEVDVKFLMVYNRAALTPPGSTPPQPTPQPVNSSLYDIGTLKNVREFVDVLSSNIPGVNGRLWRLRVGEILSLKFKISRTEPPQFRYSFDFAESTGPMGAMMICVSKVQGVFNFPATTKPPRDHFQEPGKENQMGYYTSDGCFVQLTADEAFTFVTPSFKYTATNTYLPKLTSISTDGIYYLNMKLLPGALDHAPGASESSFYMTKAS